MSESVQPGATEETEDEEDEELEEEEELLEELDELEEREELEEVEEDEELEELDELEDELLVVTVKHVDTTAFVPCTNPTGVQYTQSPPVIRLPRQ